MMYYVSNFTTFLPQPEGPFPCRYPSCPCRYFLKEGGANKHMVSKHGVTVPSSLLYPPAPKKSKKKPSKGSPKEGAASMRSMPSDGSCAYHLASMAMYATAHLDEPDIDHWPTDGESARSAVVANYLGMRDQLLGYLAKIPADERSSQLSQWESLVSEDSAESFIETAIDQKEWGGAIELAIAMNATTTGIIIVQAALISEDAADVDVQGAVQPAMLEGLADGAAKTHNVFAILKKDHYYLGYVKTGGVDRGLFKVGAESDAAKILLIDFLKSTNSAAIQRKRKRGRGKPKQGSCLSEDDEPQENALPKKKLRGRQLKPTAQSVDSSESDEREEPKQASCLSEDNEPQENALAKPPNKKLTRERQQKPTAQSAENGPVSSEYDGREEKDCCNESRRKSSEGDSSSDEYDLNQMVIYACEDVPGVSLVGAVTYVVRYDGFEDEYLGVHRYGYVSQNKPAWSLDYTKSFKPAYLDPKDNNYAFTFKPKKGLCKHEAVHEIAPTNVKAKFELTSNNKVPGDALSAKSAAALTFFFFFFGPGIFIKTGQSGDKYM